MLLGRKDLHLFSPFDLVTLMHPYNHTVHSLNYGLDGLNIIQTYQCVSRCTPVLVHLSCVYNRRAWSNYGLHVLNITIHTEMIIKSMNAYVWCWGKTSGSLNEILSVTMGSCKVKSSLNSNLTLIVLNLHKKTPKGATTKIQVKRIKRDIKIIILFSDNAINNTVIQ